MHPTLELGDNIDALNVDDPYTIFEQDDYLILTDNEIKIRRQSLKSTVYENDIKQIINNSSINDDELKRLLINSLLINGIDGIDGFQEDIAPKIFKKLKLNIKNLLCNEEIRMQKLNSKLYECKVMENIFNLSEKFNLTTFTALEEFNNSKLNLNDQLKSIKMQLDVSHTVATSIDTASYTNKSNIYENFAKNLYKLLFYLIKRKQNLDNFMREFTNVFRNSNKILFNLRLLINYMLKNCDLELRQRLINLLYTSNPIPMLNPIINDSNEISYDLTSELYWLFDNTVPTLLSFSIDYNCKGKSRFLNELLITNYELHKESIYFDGTIDIQFDKNFTLSTRRNVNIADAHGVLNEDIINRVCPLFDGFLVHTSDIFNETVNNYETNEHTKNAFNELVQLLLQLYSYENCQMIILIVRDVNNTNCLNNPIYEYNNDENTMTSFSQNKNDLYEKLINIITSKINVNNRKKFHICSLPNLSDPHIYNFDYYQVMREYIFDKIEIEISLLNRKLTIQDDYKAILNNEQAYLINDISFKVNNLIKLIYNAIKFNNYELLFDLYPIFCKYSKTKIELNKIHFFSLDENIRLQLGQKCYKYISHLDKLKIEKRTQAIIQFQELLFSNLKLIIMPIFVQYLNNLQQIRSIITSSSVSSSLSSSSTSTSTSTITTDTANTTNISTIDSNNNNTVNNDSIARKLIRKLNLNYKNDEKQISYDIFWRELIQLFIKNPQSIINQNVLGSFNEFVLAGDPFEILDGDNMYFNFQFLSNAFQSLSARIKVVSVIGPQNSGKSTLLNYMFGCVFSVSDGRTTKGIYGSLIKSNIPEYDYFLILDTEGLQSKERDDPEYDRKITLFCFAVSNVVIVNVKDQITADISRMLEFCADSLKQIRMTTVPKPEVYFVLNQQADPNIENHLIAMRKIISEFKEKNLDGLLDFSEAYFKTLPSAFNTISIKINSNRVLRCLATSQEFIDKVNIVANDIIKYNTSNEKRNSQPFKDMRTWIEFAHIIFGTINKFPNLTYFKDVNERQQNDRIREWMRVKMEKEFSSKFKNFLSNQIKENPIDDPNQILNQHFHMIHERLRVELDHLCQICGTSSEIRMRNNQFLDVQITHTKNAWLRALLIDKQKENIKSTVTSGKGKIDLKIREIIQRNQKITIEAATIEFDYLFERILNDIQKEINDNNLTTNACAYIYSLYIIYEKELFNIKCFEDFIRKSELEILNCLNDIKAQTFFSLKQTVTTNSSMVSSMIESTSTSEQQPLSNALSVSSNSICNDTKLMSDELIKFKLIKQDVISELYLDSCINIEKGLEKLKKISKKNLINTTLDEFGLYVENDVIENEISKPQSIGVEQLNIKNIPKLFNLNEKKSSSSSSTNGTLQSIKNFFARFSDKPIIQSFSNTVALTNMPNLISTCLQENSSATTNVNDEKQQIDLNETLLNINETTNTKLFCQHIRHRFTKFNKTLHDIKDLFDYGLFFRKITNCVEKRLKSQISGSRPVELEIVQGVVSDINHEIKLCDDELDVFDLHLSIEAKNLAHQIAFKKLYEFYISNLKDTVKLNLLNLINEKEKLYKFFIAQVVPDAQKDTENSVLISNSIKDEIKSILIKQSKELIRLTMNEYAPMLSRLQIQKNCDIIVSCTNDKQWIFDYVVSPTKVIINEFEIQWLNITQNINIRIKKLKDNLLHVFDCLNEKLNDLLELLNKLNNGRDNFIVAHLFEVISNEQVISISSTFDETSANDENNTNCNSSAYSNLHYQGVATSKFVFDYLLNQFNESYKMDKLVLKLNLKEADMLHKRALNADSIALVATLNEEFEKCSIGNLRYFLVNLIERVAIEKENFLNYKCDFNVLDDDEKLYDFYLDRIKSCEKLCPCCAKPCDCEHFKVQSIAGSENNKHRCSRGHQFRGMNGFKVHESNQPSFKICEEMNDTDLIVIGNKKMKWSAYKKLNSDWDFETALDVDINTWKGKSCNIWSQIGLKLCKHYDMEYIEFNNRNDNNVLKPIHFILALDSSSSMRGDKWNTLMDSLNEFLTIRSEEGNEEDVLSIITFGSEAIQIVTKSKIEKNLLEHVEYVGYYATYFSIVLQRMIQTMHENLNDTHMFGLVLMSDGKPTFIENSHDIMEKIDIIKEAFEHKIYKFWSIGFGNESNSNFNILRHMADKFREKGKFLNSETNGGLVQVYTEIARDNARMKQQ